MNIIPEITVTPIQEITCSLVKDNRLFVKREDLLPYSFGGNKVRISAAFMKDARDKGATGMIIYGDLRSNLCRVMASMCADEGMPCVMVATAAHEEEGSEEPMNARLIRSLGVTILPCEKDRIAQTVDQAFDLLREQGRIPYYIYGNRLGTGNEATAASAYAQVYSEMIAQEERCGCRFDRIFLPYGTGSTQGGLICGQLQAQDHRPQIIGISISSRTRERALSVLENTVSSFFARQENVTAGTDVASIQDAIHLETGYNCGGYGIYNERILAVIRQMLKETTIPMDPTYTGKAFAGMLDYIRDHQIRGENLLFLHTGGLPLFIDSYRMITESETVRAGGWRA